MTIVVLRNINVQLCTSNNGCLWQKMMVVTYVVYDKIIQGLSCNERRWNPNSLCV